MKKALVTGASGFIGHHLVSTLRELGVPVRAVVRDAARARTILGDSVECVVADLSDAGSLRDVGAGCDVVFHNAVDYRAPRAHVPQTRNLLGAVPEGARWVQMSSIAAIGIRPLGTIDERTACRPETEYGNAKLEADHLVLESVEREQRKAVILRPPTVYGPGETYNFLSLCRAIQSGRFALIGDGRNRIDFLWVGNLVDAMIAAADAPIEGCEVFNIANDPALPFRDTVDIVAREVRGRPISGRRLPLALAKAIALPLDLAARLLSRELPLGSARVRTMSGDLAFDLRKARERLGYRPTRGLADTIGETVAWYRKEGLLR